MRILQLFLHFILLGWLFSWLNSILKRLPFFSYLQHKWQSFTPFWKNIVIGILFTILFIGLYDSQWIADIEDLNVDWMISLYRGQPPLQDAPPFVILDIDETTYRQWQEPVLTPRDKLLQLLDFAVTGQSKLIIIDVVLGTEHDKKQDAALQNYLANYEANHCQTDCPHILLAQGFRLPANIIPYNPNYIPYFSERSPSFLDAIVAKAPHVHWAATLFDRETDRILRRWQLWTATCTDGKPAIVPSISLLSSTLLADSKHGATRLERQLTHLKPNCANPPEILSDNSQIFEISDSLAFDLQPSRLSRRILYTIPWRMVDGDKPQKTVNGALLIKRIPAFMALQKDVNNKSLQDNITIIGGSFLAGRDWHSTPLGWMPGMYVLANSINSLQQYGVLQPPPIWKILLFALILVIFTSWLLTRFNSFWAMLISIVTFVIILIPISFWLFKFGIWLSFAIPLAAIQLRQLADSFKEPVSCKFVK